MTATTHSSTQGTGDWLIFRIGRVACAVPALSVASILPLPEHITALPGADAGSPGLFHHGSGTVAVIDLRHRFGCDRVDPQRGRLLLGQVGGCRYAFWVDSIAGLAAAGQVRPAPLPPELPHNVFSAALRYQDEIVLCSDLARLLAMRDAGGLRQLVCAAPPPTAAPPMTAPPAGMPVAGPAPTAATTEPRPGTVVASRPLPAPEPDRSNTRPAVTARPAPPAATSASRRAAVPPPPRPAARPIPPPPRPAPATTRPAATAMAAPPQAPWSLGEVPAYQPASPTGTTSTPLSATRRTWPALLVLALLIAGAIYALRPTQPPAPPPTPPVARMAPEPLPAPPPAPPPATEPVPEIAAAGAATPIFQGDGLQVEQNGEEITIVIERARPDPEPEPEPMVETAAHTAPRTAPPATPPAPPPAQMYVHTVVRGDTLWAIAERYLDDPWRYRELAQLSRIRNPDLIYPGNKVRIIIR